MRAQYYCPKCRHPHTRDIELEVYDTGMASGTLDAKCDNEDCGRTWRISFNMVEHQAPVKMNDVALKEGARIAGQTNQEWLNEHDNAKPAKARRVPKQKTA